MLSLSIEWKTGFYKSESLYALHSCSKLFRTQNWPFPNQSLLGMSSPESLRSRDRLSRIIALSGHAARPVLKLSCIKKAPNSSWKL